MAASAAEPIDAVYTWVDGSWPGYATLLRSHAHDSHDLNPNRYRDNMSVLKYSLRSLARHAPWIRRLFLVTCRPQRPAWLDTDAVTLVHHDEFMPPADLPTFNSFAIVSNLHRLPGLSRRFVYIEDDRLLGAPVAPDDWFAVDGRPRVFLNTAAARAPRHWNDSRLSPWNRAVAYANRLLDERYGAKRRRAVAHAPLPVDLVTWRTMTERWPQALAATSASRFRATGNVAPEYLYPQFLLEERLGVVVPRMTIVRNTAYHPLNNVMVFQRANLKRIAWQRPQFVCMNDNFGDRPDARVVALAGATLERWFPERSKYEGR